LTRKSVENEPLKIFLALSDVDRRRAKPLDTPTADRMARSYPVFGSQYVLFSEAADLSNASINQFLDAAEGINSIKDQGLRAGAATPSDSDAHDRLVEEMIRIFESQRLISLQTIFDLDDNLESLAKGQKVNSALINKAAGRIAEIQLPRASLSGVEKNALAFGYWSEKHIEQQRKLNLRALIDNSATDPKKLDDIRGLLAPFLRDTLIGLNYAHYAPPGAQILHTNPLFVRSHDFVGLQGSNQTWRATE